ncbi:MAG: flavin reductase [Bacteroidia bacterium]|nr:flavin reductase [Bacteroidia bacterium]
MNPESYFKISYGLYLVTTQAGNKKGGYVANTLFQVTANPPQFAISCSKENYTTGLIKESGVFGFSILSDKATTSLVANFGYKSGRDFDKFAGVNYFKGKTGVPIITDSSVAWFECKVTSSYEVGTHVIFIGEVVDNGSIDEKMKSLTYTYYREVLKGYSPKNAPTYIEKANVETLFADQKKSLEVWQCQLCHYEYEEEKGDPISGIQPGTLFIDLPDDWLCPICGVGKLMFEKE